MSDPSPPSESYDDHVKRVNIKEVRIGFYKGVPHFKIIAVNGDKAYAYNLEEGVYPTLTAMIDARTMEDDKDVLELVT